MLEILFMKSRNFIRQNNLNYQRYFIRNINLEHRLSIILGPRGIGKTTTIAQYIAQQYTGNEALYVSLDDISNASYTMLEIAEAFDLENGKLLCFDEIHKYVNWSGELKTIYDTYPKLKVIVSGSSALEIHKGSHDLSRRAIVYRMFGMSFREYMELHHGYDLDTYELDTLLSDHQNISESIVTLLESKEQRILPLFKEYLRVGYYPYFLGMQNESMFFQTLRQNINVSIEGDLLSIYPTLNGNSIKKLKKLLAIIMQSVPFTPKMSELKKVIEVKDDRTLKEYLSKLDDAGLIQLLMKSSLSMKALDKPEKIYVANTNLLYVGDPEMGTVRETFFLNQLHNYYGIKDLFQDSGIYAADQGDFYLEETYTFEVGGKNKSFKQIKNIPHSYIASDEIEIGYGNKIPLWLFGFLY